MLFSYGNKKSLNDLQGKPWYMLELSNEKTIETTLRRLGTQAPGIFRNNPVEFFVPIARRDLDVFELSTTNYIFVRTAALAPLLRLKTITGVVAIVTVGESPSIKHAILTPDEFVQIQIKECEQLFYKRAAGIKVGSFVRIVDGAMRDYCGTVSAVGGWFAVVQVNLLTKSVLVETPARNLLNLAHVPERERVFYYGPVIRELEDKKLLKAHKEPQEEKAINSSLEQITVLAAPTPSNSRFTRQQTVTALVRRLVGDGLDNPMEIAKLAAEAVKRGDVKKPRNWFIVYCIIKDTLMARYRKDPKWRYCSWRDVVRSRGGAWKQFKVWRIATLAPTVDVPTFTLVPLKDGRSREARLKKKAEQEKAAQAKSQKKSLSVSTPSRIR